ncbi:MAG: hypothetical protein AAFY07_04405 [Pseudomonadota bacterium]
MLKPILAAIVATCSAAALADTGSNFSSVGFEVETSSEKDFLASIMTYINECEPVSLDEDDLVCVARNSTGGELRIGLRQSGETATFITANPALVGESRFAFDVDGTQSDPDWEPFEFRLSGTFGEFNVPVLIELADPRNAQRFQGLEKPQNVTLDLTAFTFEPSIYENAEAFQAEQLENGEQTESGERIIYASDFFIPSGLFGEEASARASFAGKVLKAKLIETGDIKHWRTLVEIQGGATVNVVFDARMTGQSPEVGNLIVGDFWLSAQIPSAE